MGLLALSQTLPDTGYPAYKGHCMLFVSPLRQRLNHFLICDWSVSVCKIGRGTSADCLASLVQNLLILLGSITKIFMFVPSQCEKKIKLMVGHRVKVENS